MFTIEYQEKLDRQTFERLFSEAVGHSAHEVERIGGEDKLLEGMWYSHNVDPRYSKLRSRVYKIDGYVVGCSHFTLNYSDDYMLYSEVLLGADQNGSKAWWYSEEAVKAEKKFLLDNSMVGTVSPVNVDARPFSVAGERTCKSFDGQQYFSKYSFRTMRETFPELMGNMFQYPENQFQILKIDI